MALPTSATRNSACSAPVSIARASCGLDALLVHLHTEHRPARPDETGGEERDAAGAAADIEHAHPLGDPGALEERPGDVAEKLVLEGEPTKLGLRALQRVRGRIGTRRDHCVRSAAAGAGAAAPAAG